jgi:O-antigen/teichoic acid export membrane protein
VLYYINLASTVVTYWLFAYKNCLVNVHQRNDITDKIGYVVYTLKYLLQLVSLFLVKDYYAYIIISLSFDVVYNITVSIVVDKIYPQYKAFGKLSKAETSAINKRVKDLFTAKIGGVISNSADTVVISAFLGLTQLAIYQNYFYVINSLLGFITVITSSSRAGIGNSIITETNEKNFNDLNKLTFMFSWIGIFCTCSLISLLQPFIELWVGEDNLLPYSMVITFCVYFFVTEIMNLLLIYKDASGIWHQDRFRPLITSLTNLFVNLILVQFWGLYGILLSTVISILFVGMPWLLKNLFSTIFHCSSKKYILCLIKYTWLAIILTTISAFVTNYITFNSLILTLIIRAIFCAIFPNLVLFIIFRKSNEFKQLIKTLIYVTNGKLKFLNKLI